MLINANTVTAGILDTREKNMHHNKLGNLVCCICGQPGADLHEIFGGRTNKRKNGPRQICIKYNIQVPLCQHRGCHQLAEKQKKAESKRLCDKIGLDYLYVYKLVHGYVYQGEDRTKRLEAVRDIMAPILRKYRA